MSLADQARASDNLIFSVRGQAQAAVLLWPYDRERSRLVFRRAFETLGSDDGGRTEPNAQSESTLSVVPTRVQLRTELLNQIASRDPELVEEILRKLVVVDHTKETGSTAVDGGTRSTMRIDASQRETFVSVALQIVERDPSRAMSLAQLSLGPGPDEFAPFVPPNFPRLLMLMRSVDPALAGLLFSYAVDRLERTRLPALSDIQALSSYLTWLHGSSQGDGPGRSETERFLRVAYNRIMRYREYPAVEKLSTTVSLPVRLDDKSAIYFIGRQLAYFFARYEPDHLSELNRRVAELTESPSAEQAIATFSIEALGPADILRQAREAPEGSERDGLYARAALSWLGEGEAGVAQAAASNISAITTRDRVYAQIARHQISMGRVEDAVALNRRIEDKSTRASILVRAAQAALSRNNRSRAGELLNDAENEASKIESFVDRSQSLLNVVNAFTGFDAVRAFEVMQSAVRAINQAQMATDDARQSATVPRLGAGDIYSLTLEETLASLGQADFDRALLLAQQLNSKDASVIAQLAVCGGGLDRATKGTSLDAEGGAAISPH